MPQFKELNVAHKKSRIKTIGLSNYFVTKQLWWKLQRMHDSISPIGYDENHLPLVFLKLSIP
jgi:hypothetical protein